MLKTIKHWFEAPQFEDKIQTRQAAQLHILLWLTLIIMSSYILINSFLNQTLFSNTNLVALAFIGVLLSLLLVMRRGYVRLASTIMITCLWIAVALHTWVLGGWHDVVAASYVNVILMTTLLLPETAIIIFTILTIGLVGAFAYAEQVGILMSSPRPRMVIVTELVNTLIISAIFIYLIKHNLKQALQQTQENNQRLQILSTNLENQVAERTQAAEAAQATAEAAQREIEHQMWLTIGQARLSEIMRGEQAVHTLANNIMRQLCSYLEVPAGRLFIREDDKLSLVGGYALISPPKEALQFQLEKKIVAQAAFQGSRSSRLEAHPHYLVISSGIGKISLPYIFLQPFLYEAQVLGVIEVGYWQPFTNQQEAFLQSVADHIAIAFHTAQNRARMNLLATQIMNDHTLSDKAQAT